MPGDLSIGVPGALGPDAIATLAPAVEAAGFAALWVNDTPEGDSLVGLAAAASVTSSLRLATGVIPVDRRPARAILDAVERLDLPVDRLTLGIGSGAGVRGALDRVAAAVEELQRGTSSEVVVGALGPRMRRLGVERAGGVLLSWLPLAAAEEQAAEAHASRGRARAVLYTRTVVHDDARPALESEAAGYETFSTYAAHFARLGVCAIDTTLPRPGEDLRAGIDAYRAGVDELVLRAITPHGTARQLRDFVARASSLLRRAPSA